MNLWKRIIKLLGDLGWGNILKITIILLFLCVVATLVIIMFIPDSPVESAIYDFLEWLDDIPVIYGSLIMYAVQSCAIILMLPGTPFNLACGFLFDVWIGAAISVASADTAAVVSFLVVRFVARDWAASQIEKRPKFKAVDKAVEKHGMWLIALIRFSPILPFGLCNYMLGLTNVPFWKYWISSTIGLAPYTIAYAYLGSLLRGLAEIFNDDSDSTESIILLSVGGGATLITIVAVALITKRALSQVVVEEPVTENCIEEGRATGTGGEEDEYLPVEDHDGLHESDEGSTGLHDDAADTKNQSALMKETTPLVPRKPSVLTAT